MKVVFIFLFSISAADTTWRGGPLCAIRQRLRHIGCDHDISHKIDKLYLQIGVGMA